jgi:hypothetical protein
MAHHEVLEIETATLVANRCLLRHRNPPLAAVLKPGGAS